MSLGKKDRLKEIQDRNVLVSDYNPSGPNNPSRNPDENSNFLLRPINKLL